MKPTQERMDKLMLEHGVTLISEESYNFAALAYETGRKDENEACAKVCEDMDVKYEGHFVRARLISEAIRARREQ